MENKLDKIVYDYEYYKSLVVSDSKTAITIKDCNINYLEFFGGKLLVNNNSYIKTFNIVKPIGNLDCSSIEKDVEIGRCKITNLLLNGYRVWIEHGADIEYILVSSTYRTSMSKSIDTTGYIVIKDASHAKVNTIKSLQDSHVEISGGNINNILAYGTIMVMNSARINSIELLDDDACVYVPLYCKWPKSKPIIKKITGQKGKIHINGDVTIESIDISSDVKVVAACGITVDINKLVIDGKQITDTKKYFGMKEHSAFYIYGPTDNDVEK